MKTPQIVYLALMFVGLLIAAHDHGKPRPPQNFWVVLVATGVGVAIVVWGGFFR